MVVFQGTSGALSPTPMLGFSCKRHPLRIYKDAPGININGLMTRFGRVPMKSSTWKGKCNASLVFSHLTPISATSLSTKNQFGAFLESDEFSSKGADLGLNSSHLSSTASFLIGGDYVVHPSSIHVLSKRDLRRLISRASSGIPYNFHYAPKEEKPRWWWRTLACIPYLMPIHVMSIFADGACRFLPFLEDFQLLTDPVFGMQLPSWFAMVYCLGVYFFVVRRKEWPYFFRFHIVMAMLLDNSLQIIAVTAGWMPYWRKLDAPFWTVVACGFLFVMLKSMQCALKGMYPEIPLFSEAAHMHCSQQY